MAAPKKTADFTYKISVVCGVSPENIKKVAGVFVYVFGNHHSPRKAVDDTYAGNTARYTADNSNRDFSKTFNKYKKQTIVFFRKLFGHKSDLRSKVSGLFAVRSGKKRSAVNRKSNSYPASNSGATGYTPPVYSRTYYSTYSRVDVGSFYVHNDALQNSIYWMKETSQAVQNGNYNRAIACAQYKVRAESESFARSEISQAGDQLTLAMLWWSVGERSRAISAMESMINELKNGSYTGGSGCEKRAEILLQKMRSGNLPSRFTPKDINTYLYSFIMEVPYAAFERKVKQRSAHYDAIANMASASTAVYRRQGQAQAMTAKHYASSEYQKHTGRSFSLDAPPAYGTEDRERWESCKRIYDIFN